MRLTSFVHFGTLFLGLIVPYLAQAQFQAPTKEELAMTSDPKAPGAAAVYLYREEKEDDPHHFRTVYARIKVLSEAGKEAATVHVIYRKQFVFNAVSSSSSRMGSATANHWDAPDINHAGVDRDPYSTVGHVEVAAIEGRTIHPDGSIVSLTGSPSDLLKVSQAGDVLNEMTFNMPSVDVGSILEYRYQVRYDRFQAAPDWQIQQPYFVHKAHYLFIPAEQFAPDRTKGGAGFSTSAMVGSNGEIMTDIRAAVVLPPGKVLRPDTLNQYVLDLTDIPPIPSEPYAPPLGSQIYRVSFYYIFTPDEKEFWQKKMGWWTRDVDQYTAATPLLKRTVDEICLPSDAPLDKARKLYAFVQKIENMDMDRTTTSGLIPRGSVESVLQDKKGTSKEVTLLYLALARAAGLNARPERVATREQGMFDPRFLSDDQLDWIVISLNIDGKEVHVDPGVRMAPFETLYWSHAGAAGVAMAANGKVETVITPLPENNQNTTVRVGTLNVSPEGAVSGTLKVGFTGQQAIRLRQIALHSGVAAVTGELNQMIAEQVPSGIAAHVDRVANLDDSTKQLVALVQVSGTLATRTGGRLVLPRLFFETRETNPFPADQDRTLPVDMRYAAQDQEQITYMLPAGYALEGKPADSVYHWEQNAAYQLKSKVEANSVTTARVLARAFTLIDAKEYGALRDFYQKVVTDDQQQLVLTAAQATKGL